MLQAVGWDGDVARWDGTHLAAPWWHAYAGHGGSVQHGDDNARRTLPETTLCLVLVPPWCQATCVAAPGAAHAFLMWSVPTLPAAAVQRRWPRPLVLAAPGPSWLIDPAAAVLALGALAQQRSPLVADAAAGIAALLWTWLQELAPTTPAPADQPLRRLLAWIDDHLDQSLTVADLAHHSGCARETLTRRFHAALGTGPAAWVRERRMARVAEALAAGDVTLDQLAATTGLRHRHRLIRLFRSAYGTTPDQWRRAHCRPKDDRFGLH